MSSELKFFLYLIELYASAKDRPTGEVLTEWEQHGIVQEIYDNYEQYHQEAIENAFADIDCLLATGKHAW